ncbi:hypothetical protein [Enterococcus italicus]|uniref:hypothetical protein n=1 Tax=Enterococcus italicus TaxID=246144 RepID=UPI003F47DD69
MDLDKFKDVDLVIDHADDNTFIPKKFVSVGDVKGRTLTVQITNNGVVGTFPGIAMTAVWTNKASGITDMSAFNLIDAGNSIFRLTYPSHMLTAGQVEMTLQVLYNEQTTTLKTFEITVQAVNGAFTALIESQQFSALTQALNHVNQYDTNIAKNANNISILSASTDVKFNNLEKTKADKNEMNSGLAQKVDKGGNEQITPKMLSQEVKTMMTGGSVAVVGVGGVNTSNIADGAVTVDKLSPDIESSMSKIVYFDPAKTLNQWKEVNTWTILNEPNGKQTINFNVNEVGYIAFTSILGTYKSIKDKILKVRIDNPARYAGYELVFAQKDGDWRNPLRSLYVDAAENPYFVDIKINFANAIDDQPIVLFLRCSNPDVGTYSIDFSGVLVSSKIGYGISTEFNYYDKNFETYKSDFSVNAGITPFLNNIRSIDKNLTSTKTSNTVAILKKEKGTSLKNIPLYWIIYDYTNIDELDVDMYFNLTAQSTDGVNVNNFMTIMTTAMADWNPNNNPIPLTKNSTINLKKAIVSAGKESEYTKSKRLVIVIGMYNASLAYFDDKAWELKVEIVTAAKNASVLATDVSQTLMNKIVKSVPSNVLSEIVAIGDSLTAQGGWTDTLSSLSGLPVFNGGTGGETVRTIAARAGADVMTIENVTIPSDLTEVKVADYAGFTTQFGYKATPLYQEWRNHVNPVSINGLTGTLRFTGTEWNDTNGVYMFKRAIVGDSLTITRPTAIRTNLDVNYNNPYLLIIFMGQNGGYSNVDDLVRMHRLVLEHSKSKYQLILGLHTGTKASSTEYEQKMLDTFGRRFFSLRQYLTHPVYESDGKTIKTCWGLQDVGLTPTSDDLAKLAVGQVPSPLMADGVHYTDATKTAIGKAIYGYLQGLNIV